MIRFALARRVFSSSSAHKLIRELRKEEVEAKHSTGSTEAQTEVQRILSQFSKRGHNPSNVGSASNPLYVKHLNERPKLETFTSSYLSRLLNPLMFGFLIALVFQHFREIKSMKGGSQEAHATSTTFKDVRGIDECKGELTEIVEYLKNPQKFLDAGAKVPKGLLLTGEPGTGKTLLARAIAGEAGVRFLYTSGSEFEEIFSGLGSLRIRELFIKAKGMAPCLIFIDEIDAIGGSRKNEKFTYSRQSLNQLLVEMDGFEQKDNIIVIAATNHPQLLDNALKRPGRFDKEVAVPLPDIKGRQDIFHLYLEGVFFDESIDVSKLARATTGVTGADINNIVNTAAIHAVTQSRMFCSQKDFDFAIDRLSMGVERRTLMTEDEKKSTAVHELGHTLAALLTQDALRLRKVTILSRGQALGFTSFLGKEAVEPITREKVLAILDIAMGGRAAEEMFYGTSNTNTGCSADLRSATSMVYEHLKGGMFQELTGVANITDVKVLSDELQSLLGAAAEKLLTASYERTTKKLEPFRDLIAALSHELVQKETMTDNEIREWLHKFYANDPQKIKCFVNL